MESDVAVDRAQRLLQQALKEQGEGRFDAAAELYQRSLEVHPTAEAHTFLGWTYSFMGKLDEAIEQCHQAIAVDPEFGNPYNDIGSYLMKQGKLEEAIGWLEKAKSAPRYEPRHYPYLNLARVYLAMGRFEDAGREYSQAQFLQRELFPQTAPAEHQSDDSVN